MEPRPPKRKKNCRGTPGPLFPIIETISGPYKFKARFNGFSVIVDKQADMEKINSMGSYGKANLSRTFPTFNKKETIILRKRLYDKRNETLERYSNNFKYCDDKNIIIVSDSDSEEELENYVKKLKPVLKKQKVPIVESLCMLLEEAYFLMYDKQCLNIYDSNDELLDANKTWTIFANTQDTFVANYIVYNYFRTRNWVVKSGLKYGGDFLLYKDGPSYYHASFLVIVNVIKKDTKEKLEECKRTTDWSSLICLNRLLETASKELLIAQVIWPQDLTLNEAKISNISIQDISVKPILLRRWVAKQERINYQDQNKKKQKTVTENS